MSQRKGRTAQVWAVILMEEINGQVEQGKTLPFPLAGLYPKGQAIRFCQEISYAKKLFDARNKQKELSQPGYKAVAYNWTLKSTCIEGDSYQLYVCHATGRQVQTSPATYAAMENILGALQSTPQQPPPAADIPARQQPVSESPQADAQEDMIKKLYGI